MFSCCGRNSNQVHCSGYECWPPSVASCSTYVGSNRVAHFLAHIESNVRFPSHIDGLPSYPIFPDLAIHNALPSERQETSQMKPRAKKIGRNVFTALTQLWCTLHQNSVIASKWKWLDHKASSRKSGNSKTGTLGIAGRVENPRAESTQ